MCCNCSSQFFQMPGPPGTRYIIQKYFGCNHHDLPSGIFIELMAIDDCQEEYPLVSMSNGRGMAMNDGSGIDGLLGMEN